MNGPDSRRVTVPAPAEGGRLVPPPRRRPQIVAPNEPGAGGAGIDAPEPAADSTQAIPVPAGQPAAEAPRRVVVPAPTADTSDPPPRLDRATPVAPPAPDERGWRRFIPSRRVVTSIAVVLLLLVTGTLVWGWTTFNGIDRVDLSEVLATGNGTNYLIVGSDSRDGVDPDDPNAAAILGDNSVGGPERSDTILVLRIDSQGARTLSVPRDLFLTISETGERSRINAAFNGGPSRLIATLRDQLGIPIHHYLEVDFVSFASMVDALGGITIDFAHPAFDTHSGLSVTASGPQKLDGVQALAYVRSRFYTEVIDGREVPEGTGDIGRVQRQQQFLSAVTSELGSTRNPVTLARVGDTLADGMRIDSDLGFFAALNLARKLRGLDPAPNALPTTGFVTGAGAQVLRLVQPGADEVLRTFGSSGATIDG